MSNVNVADVPSGLHRKVKAQAAMRGITLREAVIEALQDWLETAADREREEQEDGN